MWPSDHHITEMFTSSLPQVAYVMLFGSGMLDYSHAWCNN